MLLSRSPRPRLGARRLGNGWLKTLRGDVREGVVWQRAKESEVRELRHDMSEAWRRPDG
jgi:hypothetical protein